ncbi:DUF1236 domain-containing protein [Maritimibacter sp. UBA3975]|uniref:DUF1236 domain-containing protein n=1 Tax=Maritimibacter sp. UBA3975 TaxID=1946833 RepID=UPI000C08F78A|nr:DUF1236 domain-containing protein [Maritimibacter sp. UBA3975]MAM62808.1 hypothetical protein [Maritimibacter sp.]|tara:strand:+ start:3386 stop:4033 length:648 start_codon:yes stop_codon:yes gene_type:complete
MFKKSLLLGSAAALSLSAGAAFAQTGTASASTDLNLRMGPGPNYKIASVIPAQGTVDLNGCQPQAGWCEVTYEGTTGWAYSPYLTVEETPVAEMENVAVVEYDEADAGEAAFVTGATGAAIGAALGGPVGAAIGGAVGAIGGGTAASLDQEVITYVQANPVEPVFLQGEPVVGVTVPENVEMYSVPDVDGYAYSNINGDTVIIEGESRQIVRVVR